LGQSHGWSGPALGKEMRREKGGELGRFREETRIQAKLDKSVGNSFLFSIHFPILQINLNLNQI
jgi:hypothetical protein